MKAASEEVALNLDLRAAFSEDHALQRITAPGLHRPGVEGIRNTREPAHQTDRLRKLSRLTNKAKSKPNSRSTRSLFRDEPDFCAVRSQISSDRQKQWTASGYDYSLS